MAQALFQDIFFIVFVFFFCRERAPCGRPRCYSGKLLALHHLLVRHLPDNDLQVSAASAVRMGLSLGHGPHALGIRPTLCLAAVDIEPGFVHIEVVLSICSC